MRRVVAGLVAAGLLMGPGLAMGQSPAPSVEPGEVPQCPVVSRATAPPAAVSPDPSGTANTSPAPSAGAPPASPEPSPSLPLDPFLGECVPNAVEVVRFHQEGRTLYVELYNPNATIGLVRSGLALAVLDRRGDIITVAGGDGFPGAPCCTIYHLPPGGSYYFVVVLLPERARVATVEPPETFGEWYLWSELEPAVATLTQTKLDRGRRDFDPAMRFTGRVEVSDEGPYNVRVQVVVQGPRGIFGVLDESIECVRGGRARPFELTTYNEIPRRANRLATVLAFPSTVIGAEGTDQEPPGCPS
jgi:hypothetical protein